MSDQFKAMLENSTLTFTTQIELKNYSRLQENISLLPYSVRREGIEAYQSVSCPSACNRAQTTWSISVKHDMLDIH
jgi:hypothetical protein